MFPAKSRRNQNAFCSASSSADDDCILFLSKSAATIAARQAIIAVAVTWIECSSLIGGGPAGCRDIAKALAAIIISATGHMTDATEYWAISAE